MNTSKGRFGVHGGQYIPETLMNAVIELERAYEHYKNDPDFIRELDELMKNYAGRPSLLYRAEKLTKVLVNGEDITDKLKDGKLTLDPIYEDMTLDIQVETEALSGDSSDTESNTESTPDSTAESTTDSNGESASESTPDGGSSDGSSPSGGTVNPVTGVIGTISAGGLIALGAMAMIKRRNKDKE